MNNQETEKKNPINLRMNKNNFNNYYTIYYNGQQPELTISIIKRLLGKNIISASIDYNDNRKIVINNKNEELTSVEHNRYILINKNTRELTIEHPKNYELDYINPVKYWEVTCSDGHVFNYPPEEYTEALNQLLESTDEGYYLKASYYTDDELTELLDNIEEIHECECI